jgi:hypothetical protein
MLCSANGETFKLPKILSVLVKERALIVGIVYAITPFVPTIKV